MYDDRMHGITPLVEIYQRWLNDQPRLAIRHGISTRKTHTCHTLPTGGITLANGQLTIRGLVCLLPGSLSVDNNWHCGHVSVSADVNSLRACQRRLFIAHEVPFCSREINFNYLIRLVFIFTFEFFCDNHHS